MDNNEIASKDIESKDIETLHFTYSKPKDADLEQGDVIEKNDKIIKILRKVHPHYLKNDYSHFLVLTQTCDLVRRSNNNCKARYLSLAAIRPFDLVVNREIEVFQESELEKIAGVVSAKHKDKIQDLIRRIMDNQHTDFFYLHSEPDILPIPSCAFLRLSIAIRAYEHYETCLNAKILTLNENFKAKLGWLVGNMYSRVGTEDWVPKHIEQKNLNKKIEDILGNACIFFDDRKLRLAQKEWAKLTKKAKPKNITDALNFINQINIKSKKEVVIEQIEAVLTKNIPNLEATNLKKLATALRNDPILARELK